MPVGQVSEPAYICGAAYCYPSDFFTRLVQTEVACRFVMGPDGQGFTDFGFNLVCPGTFVKVRLTGSTPFRESATFRRMSGVVPSATAILAIVRRVIPRYWALFSVPHGSWQQSFLLYQGYYGLRSR